MTFSDAVSSLTSGNAAKLSTWSGYVYRTDITTGISPWAASTAYVVGSLVTNGGFTYVCKEAHTSEASFDSSKWETTAKYTLTFKKRNDTDTAYTFTPTIDAGEIVYHCEPDGTPSAEEASMLKMDGALLQAMMSSDWIVGSQSTFEASRSGVGKIW